MDKLKKKRPGPKPLARPSRRYGESYPAELADEIEAAARAAGETVPQWVRGAVRIRLRLEQR